MSGAAGPGGDRTLIALISDEDTATGLLLAGIGHISGAAAGGTGGRSNENGVGKGSSGAATTGGSGGGGNNDNMMGDSEKAQKVLEQCREKNFFIVNSTTTIPEIESAFHSFTQEREDVAILLITQPLAEKIRQVCDRYTQAFPAVLEIPSKDAPYDPSKDSILKRVQKLFGE